MNAPDPVSLPPLEARDYHTIMIHFYRGEVGRIMLWRQRLDTTTNWAIAATVGVVTYALGHVEATHLVFFFANVMAFLLLIIESRRYRYYDAFRARVRMLEAHYLRPAVLFQSPPAGDAWRTLLAEDLALPSFKISRLEAIYRRFGRNYVWLFLILTMVWIVKVWAHCPGARSFCGFWQAMAAGQPLPVLFFWTLLAGFYAIIVWFTVGALRLEAYNPETDISMDQERAWQV